MFEEASRVMVGRNANPRMRLRCISVFLLSFSFTTFAQTGVDPTPEIASALQNREFQKALDLTHSVLQASPGNSQLWAMQGEAYAGQGRTKEALASFHAALKISPDYLPALRGAIQIEYDAADPAAIPLLKHMLRLRPADAISHGMLAVLEYQQGNCAAAAPHFENTGTLFDSKSSALHAYAICEVRLKQPDKAAKIFQRALALNPDDQRERRLLASIQLLAHNPQDALATLGPLLQSNPQGHDAEAETLELAATAYEENKDTPQAV